MKADGAKLLAKFAPGRIACAAFVATAKRWPPEAATRCDVRESGRTGQAGQETHAIVIPD
jgi:hypothetical protein